MTKEEWLDNFSDNLKYLIYEEGTSQRQLSVDSGVSVGMISEYINKIATPSVFAIINMAYSLDVEIDDLIDFGEPSDK